MAQGSSPGRRRAVSSPGEYLVTDWAEAAQGSGRQGHYRQAHRKYGQGQCPARVLDDRVAFATDQRAATTLALMGDSSPRSARPGEVQPQRCGAEKVEEAFRSEEICCQVPQFCVKKAVSLARIRISCGLLVFLLSIMSLVSGLRSRAQ